MLRSTFWPTLRVMSLRSYEPNPADSTFTVYPEAGISDGAAKIPFWLVSRFLVIPLDSFETVTLAPGTEAPEASRTMPEMPATPACCAKVKLPHVRLSNTNCRVFLIERSEYPAGRVTFSLANDDYKAVTGSSRKSKCCR